MKNCENPECTQSNPQPEANFEVMKDGPYTWLRGKCRICRSADRRKWLKKNTEKFNAYMRDYNATHKHTRKWKDRYKNKVLKARYGITLERYNEMFKEQNGKCAICEKSHRHENALPVDHDHSTGKVRGLLCHGCNRSMHWLDKPEMMIKAQSYLAKYK